MAHVMDRHSINGETFIKSPNRTNFPAVMSEKGIKRDIMHAYRNPTKEVEIQGARILFQGNSRDGKSTIEMWFNTETNVVETAYPITR